MMAQTRRPCDVLLVAADLNERRLLFGELLEAGYDVRSLPGFAPALGELLQHAVAPRLILLDVQGDQHATPKSVEHLATLSPGIPLILIVGLIAKPLWDSLERPVTAMLYRPITIGQVVETVRQILSAANGN
jgi:DNA-binding NtrC family response regulator